MQDISYLICVLLYVQIMKTAGSVYASLESVEMSNNVLVLQEENAWNQYALNDFGALSLGNTEVHFKHIRFCNNNIAALYSYNSDLHFHGVNVFRNNTAGQCGGALVLGMDSQMYLHRGAQVYIVENTALKYGGGMCGWRFNSWPC